MQIYADVTRLPISVIGSEQGPALGAAIHAAVAAGAYADVARLRASDGQGAAAAFQPDESRARVYDRLFAEYLELHDHFGRDVAAMRRLKRIRREAVSRVVAARRPPTAAPTTVGRCRREHPHRGRRGRPATARRGLRAARRADPLPAGGVDGRQRLGARARARPAGDQAQRSRLRRPDSGEHGRLRPATAASSTGRTRRRRTPRPRPTSTGSCRTSAAWCTRTRPTRPPGLRAASRCPCVLTMAADEFGGEIPVGPFAIIGDDSIGRGIVETLRGSRSPAVLMQNHGVFTIGPDAEGGGEGGGDVRGRRPHGAPRPPARRPGRDRARRPSTSSTSATRTSTASPDPPHAPTLHRPTPDARRPQPRRPA